MKIEAGVKLLGLRPELLLGLMIFEAIYSAASDSIFTITCAANGEHSANSLHYTGAAADMRSHDIPSDQTKTFILTAARQALGSDFDLLLEDQGGPNEHFHLEWQPHTAH